MKAVNSPVDGRLRGQAIFLSASVPDPERHERYRRIPDAATVIEEGVISVARAVFSEGGKLVFGGHPCISPLVATVMREYALPQVAEEHGGPDAGRAGTIPGVIIYQSEAYRDLLTEPAQRLTQQPGVTVRWVEAAPGERVDPEIRGRPQAEESLLRMRRQMIQEAQPIAMICLGGMEGVEQEAQLFTELRPGHKIYTFATSGGAAAILARNAGRARSVTVPDEDAMALVERFRQSQQTEGAEHGFQRRHYLPYAHIAQRIIGELIGSWSG